MRPSIRSRKEKTLPVFLVITALLFEPSPVPLYALEQMQSAQPHSPKSFPEDLTAVSIPEEIGKLTELHRGRRPETLILIQDAHAIPDAQRNIQKLIGFFQESYGVTTITLEGAKGFLDTTFLRAFPQPEILKKTLERYLEESELSGGNAAALLNAAPSRYAGVEPWELYEKGTLYFLEALEQDSALGEKIREKFQKIELEKEQLYPPELRRIDKALSDFRNEKTELGSLLQTLSEVLPPDEGSEIEALARQFVRGTDDAAARNEKERLESEVRRFARVIETHLETSAPSTEIRKIQTEFNEKIQAFQTSRLSVEEFGIYLTNTAERLGIEVNFSGNLQTELGFARKLQQIEGTLFFDELERYAERVKKSLFTEDSQRLLDRESTWLELADRLRRLSLSHKDWEKIESLLKNDSAWIEGPGSSRGEARFAPLMRGMKAHLGFYETALARDRYFIQETLKLMRQNQESSALFISGGFHSQGLTHLLRQEGYSYLLVTPAVKSLPRENVYHQQMRGEVSWSSYFEDEQGKVNLYEAFQRGARERLLAEAQTAGIPAPSMIKNWRDEIIRQLAAQGRVSSAADYTRFLDELSTPEKNSDPIKIWGARIQETLKDLNILHSSGRLSPETVLQTANRSLSAQAAVYSQQTPVSVRIDLLPGITARAELRSEEIKPAPEDKGGEIVPARTLITQNSLQELALRAKESQAPAKPAGFLRRMIQAVKGSVSQSVIAGFKRDLRREDRLYHHWFLKVIEAGPDAFIGITEEVLNPANTDISAENRGHVIAYLFSRRWAPKGAEYYALSVLPRLTSEDFINAYLRGTHTNFNAEVFEMLLEYNTPDSKRILTEIARSSEWPNVRRALNHALIEAAGNKDRESTSRFATEILQEANRVEAGKSYEKLLEIFVDAKDVEGLYTEMPTPSLADLRRLGDLPFEVNIFPSAPNTVIIVKGGEASVTAVFPGTDTRGMSLHNHPPYPDGSISPIPSGYPTRGVYGSEDYRGDLILVDSSPYNYIVTQNGISRYYIDPAPEKPAVPFKMDLYFSDGSIPQVMEARAKGDSKRHFFDHKDPLLFDSTGKARDFLARGMLGPNNQSYNIQFFTWETLLRDFSEGRISNLLDFLHPNLLNLLAHNPEDFNFLANALVRKGTSETQAEEIRQALTEQQTRLEQTRTLRETTLAADAAPSSEIVDITALSVYAAPGTTDLVTISGLDTERAESYGELITGLGELFTSEQRLRTFLTVMLQTDYPKAIELARRHLGAEHSPQIRRAVIIGLANGAVYLQPDDTAFFLNAAMTDSDFRVQEASLELLKNARLPDEDIVRFIQRAGKSQINTTRIVLYAGEMQLSREAKKTLFLLFSANSESYRRFLAQAFSGDLFNYAPVHFYISLHNANFSSADNTEILSQVFENLSSFEISGLFNSPFSANNIIDRFKLDDADLKTLSEILERRDIRGYARVLKEKMTVKPLPDLPPEPVLEAPTVSPEYEDPEWRPLQLAKKQLERKTIQIVRESDLELKKALMAEWVSQALRLAPTEKDAYSPGSYDFFTHLETFLEEAQKMRLDLTQVNTVLRPVLDKLGRLGKGRVERARDHVLLKTGAEIPLKEEQYKFYSEWLSRWVKHVREIGEGDHYNSIWEANNHFKDFFEAIRNAGFTESQNAALLKQLFGKQGVPASSFAEIAPLIHRLNLTAEDAGVFYLTFHKSGVDFLKQSGFGAKKSLLEYSTESSLTKNPALLSKFLKTLVQEIPAFSSDAVDEPLRILLRALLTAKLPVVYDNELLSGLPVFSGTEEGAFLGAMQNNGIPLPENIHFIEGIRLRYPGLIASIQLYAEEKSIQISKNEITNRLSLEEAQRSTPELPALPFNTTRNELREPQRPPDFSPYGKPFRLGGSYFNADGQEIRIVDNITLPFQYARSDEFGRRFILFAIAGLTFRIREMTRAEEDRYLPGAAERSELDPGELAMAEILPYTVEIYDAATKSYFTVSETFFESGDESGQSKSLFIGRVLLPEGIMNLTDPGYMGQRPVNLEDRPDERPADNKSTIAIYDELDPGLSGRFLPYRFHSSAISRVLDTPDLKTFVEDHRSQSPDYVDSSAYQRPGHVEIAIVESSEGAALKITDRGSRNGTEVPLSQSAFEDLGGESELSQRYNPIEDNLNNSLILSADSLPEDGELDSINWGILNRQRKGREITPGAGMRFQPKFPFRILLEDSQTQSSINLTLLFNPEKNTFHLYDPFDLASSLEVFDFSKPLIYQGESLNLPIQAFVEELKTMPGKKSVRLENTDTTGRWKIFVRDARAELRAEASEKSAEALIESLNPAARKPLTPAQAEVISFLGNLNYDAFEASVETAWTSRSQTGENTLSDALVRTIQAESDALRRHISDAAKDFDGIISLGLATRAGSGSFLRQLIGLLEESGYPAEVLAESSIMKELAPLNPGSQIIKRSLRENDWAKGIMVLRSTQKDVPVALDGSEEISTVLNSMFNGLVLSAEDIDNPLISDYAELLFAASLIELAKIMANPEHQNELLMRRDDPLAKAEYLKAQLIQQLTQFESFQSVFSPDAGGILRISGEAVHQYLTEMAVRTSA